MQRYMDLQARAIMHLAARPNHLPLDNQFGGTAALRSLRCQFQTAGDKDGFLPPSATFSQAMQTGIRAEGFLRLPCEILWVEWSSCVLDT